MRIPLLFLTVLLLPMVSVADGVKIPFFYGENPYIDKTHWYTAHGWANGPHQSCEWRKDAITRHNGTLKFTLSDNGGQHRKIGCAEIRTHKKFGYGRYETRMKPAAGKGINSAFFTYTGKTHGSDEHDEIDFEFLGKNPRMVQVMYWRNSKGSKPKYVQLDFDASKEFHNYAFEWEKNEVRWYIDDQLVHTEGKEIQAPQNEQHIFFSLWTGSDDLNDWLGKFKYKTPTHSEMEWVKFTPYPNGEKPKEVSPLRDVQQ